jgi:hypothetical protein
MPEFASPSTLKPNDALERRLKRLGDISNRTAGS